MPIAPHRPLRAAHATIALWIAMVALVLAPASRAGSPPDEEHWHIMSMDGQKLGYLHSTVTTNEKGNRLSTGLFKMAIARGPNDVVRLEMESIFEETTEGEPVRIETRSNLGGDGDTRTIYLFQEDSVVQLSDDGRRKTRKTVPMPRGEWLTPLEVAEFVESRLDAGADTIAYATIDPTTGLDVIYNKHAIVDRNTTVEAAGKTVPAIKWITTTSIMPGLEQTSWVSPEGEDIVSTFNMGGLKIEMLATEREVALADFDAPEMMASTLVRPDKAIDDARNTTRATYTLRTTMGPIPDMPTTAAQRVTRIDEHTLRVTLDTTNPVTVPRDQPIAARYTEPSIMIGSDDPAIIELTRRATEGVSKDPTERAEAMRAFVETYIDDKTLGVGFATASETCQTRQGDCSEHGVLLCAMLRADGIPARTASGLVYIDGFLGQEAVFGYHMWTQALIDQPDGSRAWLDLDAAIGTMDAAHITTSTSSLADNDVINSMVSVATLMGDLQIEVESVE